MRKLLDRSRFSTCLLITCLASCRAAGVNDLLASLEWHEPKTLSGQEVVNIPDPLMVKTCSTLEQRVTVLDLGKWALQQDLQPCSLGGDVSDIVRLPHSGQLHLAEAIKASLYYTPDLEKAEVVVVNDFCYYHTGQAYHTEEIVAEDGSVTVVRGGAMAEAYRALVQSPRFQRLSGADFVFYDSHAGSGIPLDEFLCHDFRNATLLTTDPALREATCRQRSLPPIPHPQVMVVPTVPHRLDPSRPDMHLSRPLREVDARDVLVNVRALCPPVEGGMGEGGSSFGMQGRIMRAQLRKAFLSQGQQVDCGLFEIPAADSGEGSSAALDFGATYEVLERSVFCLVLPGQTGAQHRLSEALMAGCIPVFIGGPFPAIPFLDELRYSAAAVFISVKDTAWQLTPGMAASWGDLFKDIQESGFDVKRDWDAGGAGAYGPPSPDRTIEVETVMDVLPVLRNMDDEVAKKKLGNLALIRSNFGFDVELTEAPNAVNTMLSGICRRVGSGCLRSSQGKDGAQGFRRCRRIEISVQ